MDTKQLLTKLSEERGSETLALLLGHHFKDDEKEFHDINKKLDKREEIAIINGEHLSHINKNIEEFRDMLTTHIKAVEPILIEYKDRQETERVMTRIALRVKKYGLVIVFISSVIGSWLVIKGFLLK